MIIKNIRKYEEVQEVSRRQHQNVFRVFQVEITIIWFLLLVSLIILPCRSYIVSKARYCKKSGAGKWIGIFPLTVMTATQSPR